MGSRPWGRHRGLCVACRRPVHFPGRLSPPPALFPADRTSCLAPASVPPARGGWRGRLRCGCWEQEDGDGGATTTPPPHEARPREASAEAPWRLPPPATICRLAPGPREQAGRWDSGSDRPRPLLAPPHPSSDPGHQCAKMATLALLASVPSGVLLGPLGRDLNWSG